MKTAGQQDQCAPWLLLCVSLCACTCLEASAPPNLVCLSDVESTFLSRLSSHEQWELAQLAGVNPPATEPATWGDRAVARRMQCLPSDRAALLVEALAELGCVPAEANRQLAASTDSGDVTARDIGGGHALPGTTASTLAARTDHGFRLVWRRDQGPAQRGDR